jgi:hypothetical protein
MSRRIGRLSAFTERYDANDIFNSDETGLNYLELLKKTFFFKGDKRKGIPESP